MAVTSNVCNLSFDQGSPLTCQYFTCMTELGGPLDSRDVAMPQKVLLKNILFVCVFLSPSSNPILQNFHSLATYLSQCNSTAFLDIVSDFHLLLFLVTNEVMPLRVRQHLKSATMRLLTYPSLCLFVWLNMYNWSHSFACQKWVGVRVSLVRP